MQIEIKDAGKTFEQNGREFTAFEHLNLSVEKGEFICLLGPSGCGKSTLLNALAGFDPVNHGSVKINGQEVQTPNEKYVTIFQHYGLLPWRSVEKNVQLGLESKKMSREEKQEISDHFLKVVGLEEFKKSHPQQLSGGQQQRVAIARALAVDPEILFMDEPFGALDALTRMKLQDEILALNRKNKKTVIFVTHDIDEAIYLADRIVIMTPNPGKIKSIVAIPPGDFHNRTSGDFMEMRSKIFELFNLKTDNYIEYII